jgi:hypothetical protein
MSLAFAYHKHGILLFSMGFTFLLTDELKEQKRAFCFVLCSLIRNFSLREKLLALEKAQNSFGFLLAYS